MQGSALIAAVTQVMKMKESIFQNRRWVIAVRVQQQDPSDRLWKKQVGM